MNHIDLQSFGQHVKVAAPLAGLTNVASRAARGLTAGAVPGAVAGAVGGGVIGGLQAEEGDGMRSAVQGALRGGLGGAAVGATGRAFRDQKLLTPGIGNIAAAKGVASSVGTGLKNFAKRQAHGFTGAYKNELGDIGMHSSVDSAKKIHLDRLRTADTVNSMGARGDKASLVEKVKSKFKGEAPRSRAEVAAAKLEGRSAGLVAQGEVGDRAIRTGITSMPGAVKGLVTNPKETAKAMWESTGGGAMGTAMAVGAPVAFAAPGLMKGDESSTGGLTTGQKLTRLGTEVGTGIATGGMAALPQLAAYSGASALADRVSGAHKALKAQEAAK